MKDKIKRVLKGQLSAATIARKTRLTVDCVLSHLALMVFDGEARVSFNRHVLQSGGLVFYPYFYKAKHGRGMNTNNAKRGMDNRLKIIKAIRELCAVKGCTTLKGIISRSKLSIKSVKNGLRVLIDNGVVFVSPKKEWHGAKVYLLTNRNIKPKKKGKYKWWNIK